MTFQRIIIKWLQSSFELILFFPMILIIGVLVPLLVSIEVWFFYLTLFPLMGILYANLFRWSKRWLSFLVGMISSGFFVYILIGNNYLDMISWGIGTTLFYRGVMLWPRPWSDLFPTNLLWICLSFYFISSPFFIRLEPMQPYYGLLTIAGMISVLLVLWMSNLNNIQSINRSGRKTGHISSVMLKQNRLAVIFIAAFIFIIAFFQNIKDILVNFILMLIRFVVLAILFIMNLFSSDEEIVEETSVGQPEMPDFGFEEEKEPSFLSWLFDMFMYVMVFLILAVLIVFALRAVIKLIIKGVKLLIEFLKSRQPLSTETTSYVDEKSKIISFKELRDIYKDRLQQWLADLLKKEPKWEDLNNNKDRIRYVYRHWLLKKIASGYTFKSNLTPKETAQELSQWKGREEDQSELISVYQKARYSHEDISNQEVIGAKKSVDIKR